MPVDEDCLFCRIVAGGVPADVVGRSPRAVAFRDIAPKAALHVLVVPTEHYRDVGELAAADAPLLAEMVALAGSVARESGGHHRLVFNTGAGVGQTVFHVHAHVLGGNGVSGLAG